MLARLKNILKRIDGKAVDLLSVKPGLSTPQDILNIDYQSSLSITEILDSVEKYDMQVLSNISYKDQSTVALDAYISTRNLAKKVAKRGIARARDLKRGLKK